LGAALIGSGALLSWQAPQWIARLVYAAEAGRAAVAREQLGAARDFSEAFQAVAEALRPSVVSIASVTRIRPRNLRDPRGRDLPEEFRRFFGDEDMLDRFQFGIPDQGLEQRGQGSGVIVSADGYVLTNNHVVRNADEVDVHLSDERSFRAKVVGTDPKTDVAVLKIEATGLVPAVWGNSDGVKVGEWVLAVGSPFGLDQTVTAGIISAKGRERMGLAEYEDFMQTDAAINPGNSGGPLVNLKGEVIGINTAIASQSGGFMGVGFAIPSNMARSVMQRIIDNGRVIRGWLGALIQDLNEDLSRSFGFTGKSGVLIGDVVPDSPAAKGGLQSGDIVTKLNGREMTGASQLRNAVADTAPGTEVSLDVFRGGQSTALKIRVGELPDDTSAIGQPGGGESSSNELGMAVRPLTEELAGQLGVETTQGVVIANVAAGGAAAEAGLRPGDVVVSVGDTRIRNLVDYREAISKAKLAEGIRLQFLREGTRRFVVLRAR
jgi:serine protease Do